MTISNESEADWAHAPPGGAGPAHGLDEHLRGVGRLAREFAHGSAAELAYLAGLWHDLGKRRPGFQRYIRQANGANAHIEGRVKDQDKTHSAAGALWAEQRMTEALGAQGKCLSHLLQYVIAGHHAGLDNWEDGLSARLAGDDAHREFREALSRHSPDDVLRPPLDGIDIAKLPPLNEYRTAQPGRVALWLRMLFSALVDADFLDTEAYMNPARAAESRAPHGARVD